MKSHFDDFIVALLGIAIVIVVIILPLQCKRATLQRVMGHPVSLWDTAIFHN
mgnify:CR=1 FL=1